MSSITLHKLLVAAVLSALLVGVTSTPTPKSKYAEHAMQKRASLDIQKTTVTQYHTLDWVPIGSQGHIPAPPPLPKNSAPTGNISFGIPELRSPGAQLGPPGTVPIPRVNKQYLAGAGNNKQFPSSSHKSNSSLHHSKRQYSGDHWYVTSDQAVDNDGGSFVVSLFDAWVENSNDFSLLQTAITQSGPNGLQSVEAGWINYPTQGSAPHLFTYFTTNDYSETGDYLGGWNTDVAGFVQYSSTIYPGTAFSTSTIGGSQYGMQIQYEYFDGNWWLYVLDEWVGFYPASVFTSTATYPGQITLANGSNQIWFYGEVYQTESAMTTSDMGSGNFADLGWEEAAFMYDMEYINSDESAYIEYSASFWDSDSSRYSHDYYPNSGTGWATYVFLGGPGAGGVVGG